MGFLPDQNDGIKKRIYIPALLFPVQNIWAAIGDIVFDGRKLHFKSARSSGVRSKQSLRSLSLILLSQNVDCEVRKSYNSL